MKIAHLPSSFPPDSVGGTESYVASLVSELDRLGHESAVVVHRDQESALAAPGVALPPYSANGLGALYECSNHDDPPGFRAFLEDWGAEVVHFHARTLGAGPDHLRVATSMGLPIVITYHTPAQSCARGNLLEHGRSVCDGRVDEHRCARCVLEGTKGLASFARVLARSPLASPPIPERLATSLARPSLLRRAYASQHAFFRGAKTIIACADFCAEILAANGVDRSKILVLRQGLAGESRTRHLKPLSPLRGGPVRVGYFGRINRDKGVELLGSAVDNLNSKGVRIRVEYVGPVESDLRPWVAQLDGKTQRHVGLLRGEELFRWIRDVDLIVIPSRGLETGPLTLLEAWDQGTPVLGADAGGIRDFMVANNQQHMLFKRGSASELAKALDAWIRSTHSQAEVVHVPGMREVAEIHDRVYSRLRQAH